MADYPRKGRAVFVKRRMTKRLLLVVLLSIFLFAGILVGNCARFQSKQLSITAITKIPLDSSAVLERLREAVRIPTVSKALSRIDQHSDFHQFAEYLRGCYPELFASPFVVRTGNEFGDALNPSLLFEWPGSDGALEPILLMSHLDVVPAGDLSEWAYPPFDGHLDESFVWGRGTLDCKHGVMAILEGVERLRVEGFQPKRTILIALGHDEELGGIEGNRQIAEWMRSRRIRLHAIFDEGGCIFMEFPGLDQPAALIGIAEKGQLQVELQVQVESTSIGHASMPPDASAISLLAAAIDQLQSNPFPARIDGGLHTTLAYIGPEMSSLATRVAMANLWLSQPFVQKVLGAKPSGNALLRTTIAPTMISGGIAENVLPQTASATLNIRLLPGDTIEHALGYLRQTIDDQRVTVRFSDRSREASPVSPVDTEPFLKLHRTIREVFPDVVVAPFVLVGGTDTVHYTDLCENIYRFIPTRLSERDTQRFHGTDERIAIENYLDIVRYYHRLITSFTGS